MKEELYKLNLMEIIYFLWSETLYKPDPMYLSKGEFYFHQSANYSKIIIKTYVIHGLKVH